MREDVFTIKREDTGPALEATLTTRGVAADIDGADITFRMRAVRGGDQDLKVDAPADNLQADEDTKGMVRYEWDDLDTDTVGEFYAEWEVSFVTGEVETFPNDGHFIVKVVEDLRDAV